MKIMPVCTCVINSLWKYTFELTFFLFSFSKLLWICLLKPVDSLTTYVICLSIERNTCFVLCAFTLSVLWDLPQLYNYSKKLSWKAKENPKKPMSIKDERINSLLLSVVTQPLFIFISSNSQLTLNIYFLVYFNLDFANELLVALWNLQHFYNFKSFHFFL